MKHRVIKIFPNYHYHTEWNIPFMMVIEQSEIDEALADVEDGERTEDEFFENKAWFSNHRNDIFKYSVTWEEVTDPAEIRKALAVEYEKIEAKMEALREKRKDLFWSIEKTLG